jgi:hypothetical protein
MFPCTSPYFGSGSGFAYCALPGLEVPGSNPGAPISKEAESDGFDRLAQTDAESSLATLERLTCRREERNEALASLRLWPLLNPPTLVRRAHGDEVFSEVDVSPN